MFASFLIVLISCAMLLPMTNTVLAQTPDVFSTKGMVSTGDNFRGVIMWTIVNGDKGTILIQSPVGRGMVHVSISPSTACGSSTPMCLFTTVVDATDNDVFKVGDTARFSINLDSKIESISLLTGTLAGFDITVDLSKTWIKNTMPPTANASVNATIANPASVYCVTHGGKLDIRSTPQGQTGVCMFSNGSECDEWSYFRGECSASNEGTNSTMTNSTVPRHFTVELNETVGIKAHS